MIAVRRSQKSMLQGACHVLEWIGVGAIHETQQQRELSRLADTQSQVRGTERQEHARTAAGGYFDTGAYFVVAGARTSRHIVMIPENRPFLDLQYSQGISIQGRYTRTCTSAPPARVAATRSTKRTAPTAARCSTPRSAASLVSCTHHDQKTDSTKLKKTTCLVIRNKGGSVWN